MVLKLKVKGVHFMLKKNIAIVIVVALVFSWLTLGASSSDPSGIGLRGTDSKVAFSQPPQIEKGNNSHPFSLSENQHRFLRDPVDFSPADSKSKLMILGTGNPIPNPVKYGPASAVIINGTVYFVDAGDGMWAAISNGYLAHNKNPIIAEAFIKPMDNFKHLFLTHLHEDHTVGIPGFILGKYKFMQRTPSEVFGPVGTEDLFRSFEKAWTKDIVNMQDTMGKEMYTDEGWRSNVHEVPLEGKGAVIFEDENVKVQAYKTIHGGMDSYAYRFTTVDGRILVFGGDGVYSKGLVEAAKGADILVVESISYETLKYAPWGGDTLEEKKKLIGQFHMFPDRLARIQKESGVKNIVTVHEQNYAPQEIYYREQLKEENERAGVKNVYSAVDGDLY